MDMLADIAPGVRTTCPYCGVGCGVVATPDGAGGAAIAGDADHPANFGKLCSKGSALGETLGLETRLLYPMVDGERASWDHALDRVADGLREIITCHGPDSVAFYLSGQLLTEDYYIANKLMKGFIGTANVDTNSRLCMASSVVGHKRAFGSDTVPGNYEDLDEADLLVLVGSNAAWCHPILFQRMTKAREERGATIVNIDPRISATGESADIQLGIHPGSDTVLFSGLLVHLAAERQIDGAFVAAHTEGFDAALERAREIAPSIEAVSEKTGLEADAIRRFYRLWAGTERVVTLYSQGVNQSAQGTDKVNAILNCHLATGRIGRPGMGPFSLTGQPNAMGGREVGGLANQLAAHMGFSPPEIDRVRRFWAQGHRVPVRMAAREGLKAVDMFDAIDRGEIKALWVMGTNPAVSLPEADRVRRALGKLDLFVVSENVASNDTLAAGAHVLLPAAAWAEKDGTVTNSERCISRQRRFLPLPGEAKPDWWIVKRVAERLGYGAAFAYRSAADIFREHATLSAFENGGTRDFDIGASVMLDQDGYDELTPFQWPYAANAAPQARLFADGAFFTPNGRARFIAVDPPRLKAETSDAYPYWLNTGRVRDQWHTMTRTGLSPRLGSNTAQAYVEVHPDDAATAGLRDGGLARLASPHGAAVLRVVVTERQNRGSLFAPIHWNDETAGEGRVGALVHGFTDPYSGQPEAKATPVAIEAVSRRRHGFVLSRQRWRLPRGSVHGWAAVEGGYLARIATDAEPADLIAALEFGAAGREVLVYEDAARDLFRAALMHKGRLAAVVFLQPEGEAPFSLVVADAWRQAKLSAAERRLLLSGVSPQGVADHGPTICACFGVPQAAIETAILEGCGTTEAIGGRLKAGTNCGSCVPELKRLIASGGQAKAVERSGMMQTA
ncbi:MAG: molybdopterin-dependent oxidoreductase [Beijerinckiaceae bacterium]|nr:molybdopterin-dependent oxidoreductase [Beijerinckiaceae bacterium]